MRFLINLLYVWKQWIANYKQITSGKPIFMNPENAFITSQKIIPIIWAPGKYLSFMWSSGLLDTEDKPIDYSLKKKVNSNAVECESSKTVSECSNDSREETLPAPPTNITSDKLTIDGRSKRKKTVPEIRTKYTKFSCHACGRHYATSSNLSRHKQTHRSIDSSQAKKCPHCDKVYVSMPALSMHILTHKLKHQCTICDKAFSRPWLLQGHMRSHTGERPYGCTRCNKKFADRSNLRAHVQTHSEEKEFKCEKCGKTFAVRSYLTKHMECSCQSEDDCGEQ